MSRPGAANAMVTMEPDGRACVQRGPWCVPAGAVWRVTLRRVAGCEQFHVESSGYVAHPGRGVMVGPRGEVDLRIVNGTDQSISYELRGGPLMMTMSECDLLPGESDEWTSPYRRQQIQVTCELHIAVRDEVVAVVKAPEHATATVTHTDGKWAIQIG